MDQHWFLFQILFEKISLLRTEHYSGRVNQDLGELIPQNLFATLSRSLQPLPTFRIAKFLLLDSCLVIMFPKYPTPRTTAATALYGQFPLFSTISKCGWEQILASHCSISFVSLKHFLRFFCLMLAFFLWLIKLVKCDLLVQNKGVPMQPGEIWQ